MSTPFLNWSHTVRSEPTRWARPDSEEEVCDLVRGVRSAGGRLRVCGSRHSWSAIAASDDVQVRLDALDRFIALDVDAGTVTIEAGCPLGVLNDVLARHDMALPILGSITEQTVAGAIATGTHGSSLRHSSLGSGVVGARLVDGTGEVHTLDADDDRLDAVRVHLGALGILTQLTLKVVPAFRLEERMVRMPFDEAADRLVDLAREHEFVKMWWLPHGGDPVVFTYDRTDAPGERSAFAHTVDNLVNATVFSAVLSAGGAVPGLIGPLQRVIHASYFKPRVRRGRSDHMLTTPMPPRHRETELAFDVAHTATALRALQRWVQQTGSQLDFLQEVRFVAADSAWMGPATGRDTCQLGVYAAHAPGLDRSFEALHALSRDWEARPHWGKECRPSWEDVQAWYPRATDFRDLARELDPDGVFRNPWLDAVLGGVSP